MYNGNIVYITFLFERGYFMLKATWFLLAITFTVYIIDTWGISLRLIVYRNKQYTLTGSAFNFISVVAKFAQTFQAPLLGILIDVSISSHANPIKDFRLIMLCATLGVFIAILLLPTFLNLFTAFVNKSVNKGSIIKGITHSINIGDIKKTKSFIRKPSFSMLAELKEVGKHKTIILLNMLISAIFTVGVLASYYGALSLPNSRLSIAGFSGSINSIASLVMLIILEPRIAMITDEAYKGNKKYSELKLVVIILIISKLIGTLLAQLLFIPASEWVVFVYQFLT